jgi:c-di-GMP-binding flagellar brake protein YcgR
MKERRKVERFDLQIESMLNVKDEAITASPPMLLSRDISCAGVFLVTDNPLPIGTSVDLNLLLSQHELGGDSNDERLNISTTGKVVRTDEQGMAVQFAKLYTISPFKLQP